MPKQYLRFVGVGSCLLWLIVAGCRGDTPEHFSQQAMFEEVSSALADRDLLSRFDRLVPLLVATDILNLAGVVDAYDRVIESTGDAELRLLMHTWSRIDPVGALDHLQHWPPSRRASAASTVLVEWARRLPRAAAVEASRRGERFEAQTASAIVQGWALSGESGVEDWIATRAAGPERTRMVSVVIAERINSGREEDVRSWAESIPTRSSSGLKRDVFRRAANQLGEIDSVQTAAWLEPHLGKAYTVGAQRELLRKWVQRDPEAAWNWISSRPDDEERYSAIEAATVTWLRHERDAALAWLESAPISSLYDPGIVAIADELGQQPRIALSWVLRISDTTLRDNTLSKTLAKWARHEGEAAGTWLRTSSLSLETRKALRAVIARYNRSATRHNDVRVRSAE